MRTYFVLALISGVLFISSCADEYGTFTCGNGMKIFRNNGFSFEFPERVKLKGYDGIDFVTYQFIDRKKIFLLVYAGDNPGLFNNVDEDKPDKAERINELKYKFFETKDTNGMPEKQVLIEFPMSGKHYWPNYLHFWYSGLSSEEQQTAEAIIFSVKLVETK